jgi:hypothetical protein
MVTTWAKNPELYYQTKLDAFNKACSEKIIDTTFSIEKGLELYSIYTAIIEDVRFLNSGVSVKNAYLDRSKNWEGMTDHPVNDSSGLWLLQGVSLVGFHDKMLNLILDNYKESLGPGGYGLLFFKTYMEDEETNTLLKDIPLTHLYEIYEPFVNEIKRKGLL